MTLNIPRMQKACRDRQAFYIVLLQWCLAHDVVRKLFHHQVFIPLLNIRPNIEMIFKTTNQMAENKKPALL